MIAFVLPFAVPAVVILATNAVRRAVVRHRRLAAAHERLGRLALPPPGPTPYQLALAGYLAALDRCAESRAERRARRTPPPPRSLPSDGDGRPPPTSIPSRGVPRSG